MSTIEKIKELLIGNDKISEAIELIIPIAKTMTMNLYNTTILLQGRYKSYEQDVIDGTNDEKENNRIKKAVINFLTEMECYLDESGDIKAHCKDYLINDNKTLFADRVKFKELIQENVQSEGAKLIFVTGAAKSGMSYLENYLIHLSKFNTLFKVVRINIAQELDNPEPFNSVSLAKLLSIKLSLDINFETSEGVQFKFERFITKLKENLEANPKIPIVFIHDFHRIALVADDINRFIYKIADSFLQDFPKAIFIFAGHKPESVPNWHSILRNYCPVYEIENINESDLKECLKSIFSSYYLKIKSILSDSITEDEYIENMMDRIAPTPSNIDIAFVGSTISDHLFTLNH